MGSRRSLLQELPKPREVPGRGCTALTRIGAGRGGMSHMAVHYGPVGSDRQAVAGGRVEPDGSIALLLELHAMREQRVDEGASRIDVRPFGLGQFLAQPDERVPLDAG